MGEPIGWVVVCEGPDGRRDIVGDERGQKCIEGLHLDRASAEAVRDRYARLWPDSTYTVEPVGGSPEVERPTRERVERILGFMDVDMDGEPDDDSVGWESHDGVSRDIPLTFGDVRWLRSHLRALASESDTETEGRDG